MSQAKNKTKNNHNNQPIFFSTVEYGPEVRKIIPAACVLCSEVGNYRYKINKCNYYIFFGNIKPKKFT